MPLAWAHAEYIQLVHSAADGQVFGLISQVADRYRNRRKAPPMEIWKFNRQVLSTSPASILRIQAAAPFRLHWTCDEWRQIQDADSTSIETGHAYVDIRVLPEQRAPIRFTFFWTTTEKWEGRDFKVNINSAVQRSEALAPPTSTRSRNPKDRAVPAIDVHRSL
jgi:glucoamylase